MFIIGVSWRAPKTLPSFSLLLLLLLLLMLLLLLVLLWPWQVTLSGHLRMCPP